MDPKRPPAPEKIVQLHPWSTDVQQAEPDAACSHCKSPFVGRDGYVSPDFSLCGVCNNRD